MDLNLDWEFGALQCHPPPVPAPARENRGSSPGRDSAGAQGIHLGWSNGSIWAWGKGETSGKCLGRLVWGELRDEELQKSQEKVKPCWDGS